MGKRVLSEILENPPAFFKEGIVFVRAGEEVTLATAVELLPPTVKTVKGRVGDLQYYLEPWVMQETIEVYEGRAGRPLTVSERFRAVHYYAERDAYQDDLAEILDP